MTQYYDSNYFVENRTIDNIAKDIPDVIRGLLEKHGQIKPLDRIAIVLMVSDKNPKRYNCMIHYPYGDEYGDKEK